MASEGADILRVVILGKTGNGKSSLGNALANLRDEDEHFKVGRGLKSETRYCAWKKGVRNGLVLEVTDTPGLCDTHLEDELIYKEVGKSVAVAEPGPHVLIFTLRCDRRFTREEYRAYQTIKEMFSNEMNRFMILVFNGLDCYVDKETIEEKRAELQKQINTFGNELKNMMLEANGRCFGINNKASPDDKEEQISDLIQMMKDLVKQNRNQYFTTPVTTEIRNEVDVLIDKRAEKKNISRVEAADEIKRDIVGEKVPGFLKTVRGYIASRVSPMKDACLIM